MIAVAGAIADKENLNTPKKIRATATFESPQTCLNSLDIDTLQSGISNISHGVDTQDLKVVLLGQPQLHKQAMESIDSFGIATQTTHNRRPVVDEDIVMESQPSSQHTPKQTRSQIDGIVNNLSIFETELPVNGSTLRTSPALMMETETQLENLDSQLESQTQIQFETQMNERDEEAVCVCQSKVRSIALAPIMNFRYIVTII